MAKEISENLIAFSTAEEENESEYLDLLRSVMNHGMDVENRTGTDTRKMFGAQLRFALYQYFPLMTTKRTWFRGLAEEMLFFLRGESDNQILNDKGINIWDQWAYEDNTLGRIYGVQWREWITDSGFKLDQMKVLMKGLRENPESRRHIVTAWRPDELSSMALPPCHMFFQVDVTKGYNDDRVLSLNVYIRSNDLFLGAPFNIGQYALLAHILAHSCGYVPGELVYTVGDAHIYANHFDQVNEQLGRTILKPPTLEIVCEPKEPWEYTIEDFKLEGYNHHPAIKGEVAV